MGATSPASAWLSSAQAGAPDTVAAWQALGNFAGLEALRRVLEEHVHDGDAPRIFAEQETLASALEEALVAMPDAALGAPGGEEDWNVAQAIGHTCEARAGLCLAAGLAAAGRFPADAPTVVPGIPGPPDADRTTLLRKIAQSQRLIERSARTVAGHETEPCPLVHPLVGRLRCGEWLLFAGVHDMMHLEQLHDLAGRTQPEGPPA